MAEEFSGLEHGKVPATIEILVMESYLEIVCCSSRYIYQASAGVYIEGVDAACSYIVNCIYDNVLKSIQSKFDIDNRLYVNYIPHPT